MEGVVLALVCLSPWGFGSTETLFELLIDVGIGLVLVLWGARMVLLGQLTWKKCPVAVGLAALFLLGLWQVVPLGRTSLGVLAPHTAGLYGQLLPAHREALPGGQAPDVPAGPVGSTLSLYPAATRVELVRLLGVFLLFAAVRNNIASPASLRRLSVVALANGALLALFGVVQFFTSARGTVYWTYATGGNVFGPFLNRNHFAWYMNLCVGLGLGLLVWPRSRGQRGEKEGRSRREGSGTGEAGTEQAATESRPGGHSRRRRRRRSGHSSGPTRYQPVDSGGIASWSPLSLLQDTRTLWVLLPLTLMLCGMVFSVSRGALLAAGLAGLVCLFILAFRSRHFVRLGTVLLVPVVTGAALLIWLGIDRVTARFATLGDPNALEAARLPIWRSALAMVGDFPAWGTGLGTFTYVESLYRWNPKEAYIVYEHAHNEYLELLAEAGVPGLVLGLVTAGLVLWLAWRAGRRLESRSARALALGALFALVATAAHAVVDFGLHIPAVLLLVTVLAAQVAGLEDPADGAGAGEQALSPGGRSPGQYTLRLWGLAPLAGAATAVLLGLVLCGQGLKAHLVRVYLAAAGRASEAKDDPDRHERAVRYLEAAAEVAPEYASVQSELGQAHLRAIEEPRQEGQVASKFGDVVRIVLLAASLPVDTFGARVARASAPLNVLDGVAAESLQRREDELSGRHLVPGMRHCLLARDLCPLLAPPQVRLADYADKLAAGDTRRDYLRRAKALVPFDPELWYFSGLQELLDGQEDEAWASWRRSLELSSRRLPGVVRASAALLTPQQIMDRVLPDRPDLVFAAALELYPDAEDGGPNGSGAAHRPGAGAPAEDGRPSVVDPAHRRPDHWAGRLVLSSAGAPAPLPLVTELVRGYVPLRERGPFLTRALELLDRPPGPVEANDFRTRAQVQWFLWRLDEAEASYRQALARDGLNAECRYEYALLLHQLGRRKEARRELLVVLSLPSHPQQAVWLLDKLTLERATKEDVLK
jgi:tetratricopeptide (TPR) repeat protein